MENITQAGEAVQQQLVPLLTQGILQHQAQIAPDRPWLLPDWNSTMAIRIKAASSCRMVTKISITGTSTSIPCRRAHNSQHKRFYHNTTANARGDGRFFLHFTEKMIEQMLQSAKTCGKLYLQLSAVAEKGVSTWRS